MAVLTRKFHPEPNSKLFDPKTGSCSIEYYNACRDPYRVAPDNKIPVPWRWDVKKTSDSSEDIFARFDERIRGVLKSHGIKTHNIGVHNLASRYPPQMAKDTIIISTHDEPDGSWKKAASEIYYGIIEPAATSAQIQMRVEIRNEEKIYKDVYHIIRDDDVVEMLEGIQPLVNDAVMEFCGEKWSSITFYDRGLEPRDSEKVVSVIVFIRPGSVDAWEVVEGKIVGAVKSALPSREIDIYVELLPGLVELC
ncbi:hypothetical protein VF21_01573 [Pseudogymnoascus sp. 05NY08]|nr:hypothetical protein VF21_01573 [Pseudogymnoascus sp. 05NY08]